MAIAKGRSDIKYERDLFKQGFDEQIGILKNDQFQQERDLKSQLVNIQSDSLIDNEDNSSTEKPLFDELENVQERHLRIRKTIMIGLYAFWELSLKAILDLKYAKSNNAKKQVSVAKDKKRSIAWNYLNVIYEGNIPMIALDIDGSVRILKNHMVHGKLSKEQLEQFNSFALYHPELYLSVSNEGCNFCNYDGLLNLLNIISHELDNAEVAINNATVVSKYN